MAAQGAIEVVIDNRIRLRVGVLGEELAEAIRLSCTYANPARPKLEQMLRGASGKKRAALAYALKREPATVTTWKEHDGELSVPRGALSKVRAAMADKDRAWFYADRRVTGEPQERLVHRPDPRAEDGGSLRWYQAEAVDACIAKQNCLLRAPTGSGKTSTLIGIIARLALPTLIVVDSAELARQWQDRLVAELVLDASDIGMIGGGEDRVRPITIGMRQSLTTRAAKLSQHFGLVLVDEVHRAAATTFMDVVDAFAAKYRIGASADETRKDRKEFLVYDAFGVAAHEVSREELIDAGAVLDVECRVLPTEFRADWYVRQRETGSPDFNRLLDEMTNDVERNAIVLKVARSELSLGEQVLVLSQRVEHATMFCRELSQPYGCGLMLGGEERRAEREWAIDEMRAGRLHAAAGTIQMMGTAIDLPSVGRGVLATPVGSNRQLYWQIRGRLCRPSAGKTAVIYVLWDHYVSGIAPLRRMLEWNRTVFVFDGGGWVDGREYLKRMKG